MQNVKEIDSVTKKKLAKMLEKLLKVITISVWDIKLYFISFSLTHHIVETKLMFFSGHIYLKNFLRLLFTFYARYS